MKTRYTCLISALLLAGCEKLQTTVTLSVPGDTSTLTADDAATTPLSTADLKAMVRQMGGHYSTKKERITFHGAEITDSDLDVIQRIPAVEILRLSDTHITDAALVNLRRTPNLRELNVANTKVTDEGLRHLKGLRRLRSLRLEGTLITDAAMDALAEHPKLRDLNISNTQISTDALDRFCVFTKLRTLTVSSDQFDEADLLQLQITLPDALITVTEAADSGHQQPLQEAEGGNEVILQ